MALRLGGTILRISENSTAPSAAPTIAIPITGHPPADDQPAVAGSGPVVSAVMSRCSIGSTWWPARGRNGVAGLADASLRIQAKDVANRPMTTARATWPAADRYGAV